jgi:hypothetical protein
MKSDSHGTNLDKTELVTAQEKKTKGFKTSGQPKEDIKEQPTSRNLSATATRVL